MGQQECSEEPGNSPSYPPPTHIPRGTRSVRFDIGEREERGSNPNSDGEDVRVASKAKSKKRPVYVTICGRQYKKKSVTIVYTCAVMSFIVIAILVVVYGYYSGLGSKKFESRFGSKV